MPREIDLVPFANNDLAADYLFSQRKYYVSSSQVYLQGPGISRPLDIWYDRPLWGKVDTKQRLVIPKDAALRPINNELSTINFVADAYSDFKKYAIAAANSLKTSMTSFIDIGNPKKAYEDPVLRYQDYFIDFLEPEFTNTYLTDKNRSEVNSFHDYANFYMAFFATNKNIPHTMTGYISSPFVSYRTSGLIIEFSVDDYDNDENKWNQYLSNDFFGDFIKIAGNFGFYVNKHVPWSIVANMNSKAMLRYMSRYAVKDRAHNFSRNYFSAEYISYSVFKTYMFLSYSSFLRRYPIIEKYNINNCVKESFFDSSYKTKRTLSLRNTEFTKGALENDIEYDFFEKHYGEMYFIKLYTKIRLGEEKIKLDSRQYSNLMIKLNKILKKSGSPQTLIFLSNFFASKREKRFSSLTRKKRFGIMSEAKSLILNAGGSLKSGA